MKTIQLACIIDDDPISVFSIKKIMKSSHFCEKFLLFSNAKEALDHLKPIMELHGETPQMIFLNLNMPFMDGWEFLDEFIKIPTDDEIIIYMVSSYISPFDLEKAKSYERVNRYIIKPILSETLNSILDEKD